MKITCTINTGSAISTLDFYVNENILWIKVNGAHIRKEISSEQAMNLDRILTDNPIGKLIQKVQQPKRIPFIQKISSNKHVGG